MLDAISWCLTFAALYGTWLNANKNREGFYYWLIADIGFCAIFIANHMWPQAFLFAVYTWLAVRGLQKW